MTELKEKYKTTPLSGLKGALVSLLILWDVVVKVEDTPKATFDKTSYNEPDKYEVAYEIMFLKERIKNIEAAIF